MAKEPDPADEGNGTADSPRTPPPSPTGAGALNHAVFRVARLHRLHAAQLLRRVGLHPGQELVMMQLWDLGPQRQTDLVRVLGSDAATMTRTVKRLENAGFVRRRPCEMDGRVTIVEPTAASLALREQVERIWSDLERSTAAGLSEEEQRAAIGTLSRIADSLADAVDRCAPPD
ncbi:MarR family transcriptional regulator [Streptomyces triticagri]|uniref:MarR family transcriptional regulator n=1 Tax=Streptomyces triticagri TaxID=2293568 RepID=A0A372M3W8_9ACTN|nr:MarR family winged helix-turn-helix transcriptional regulator [Streptomyces triticagri]RFU85626.1 MarR family transcriptional regulator [Streptomyces triticagri]